MKPKHQRLLLVSSALLGLGIAATLTFAAFQEALVFYYTPFDLSLKNIPPKQRIRVGGFVALHSVRHDGNRVRFQITDHTETLAVTYRGLLPDLFREGQGVVVEGYLLNSGGFQAETVFAKHDEKYMPKEVADQLRQTGRLCNDQ